MALRNSAESLTKGLTLSSSVRLIYFNRSLSLRHSSTLQGQASQHSPASTNTKTSSASDKQASAPATTKTVAQADAELRERLERMSGDGGAAGIEYEDGKPSAMKRGVRNNMFRVI